MRKGELTRALELVRTSLYYAQKNIDVTRDFHVDIKYKAIDNIMFKIFQIPGEPRKKQIEEIIKMEYISAYTKCAYEPYKEEDEVKYVFIKDLIDVLNIKM